MADAATIVKEEVSEDLMNEIFGGFTGTPEVGKPSPFTRKLEPSVLDELEKEGKEPEKDTMTTLLEEAATAAEGKTPVTQSPTVLSKLIEQGALFAFDDGKKPEEYDEKETEDLILANLEDARNQGREEALSELPEEVNYLVEYVKAGGTDITGTLSMLGQVREQRELDIANPDHHEMIVRNYMILKDEPDEVIDTDIAALKDRKGAMEAKAKIVKPLLDKILKDEADAHLKDQQEHSRKVAENRTKFTASVKATVDKGEINGIKLEPKVRASLMEGLVSMSHQSVNGRPTNLMGKLLEEYTSTKPNLELVVEALYLLSNPEEYRAKVRQTGANTEAEKNRKLLKQAEADKSAADGEEKPEESGNNRARKLPVQRNIMETINKNR
jgi:hypothetical protein